MFFGIKQRRSCAAPAPVFKFLALNWVASKRHVYKTFTEILGFKNLERQSYAQPNLPNN